MAFTITFLCLLFFIIGFTTSFAVQGVTTEIKEVFEDETEQRKNRSNG